MGIAEISVQQLARELPGGQVLLLDVREPWEVETAAIGGALCIPMNDVPDNLEELQRQGAGRKLVVMCHSGKRSAVIARYLQQSGFDVVCNLGGGITAWSTHIDSTVPTY